MLILHATVEFGQGRHVTAGHQIQQEGLPPQLAEQVLHAGVLDEAPLVDDADVAAQHLGLFQVMGGEYDGDTLLVQILEETPHGTTDLDVHPGGRLIQDQQPGLVHQGAGYHQPALHAAGEGTGRHVALVPQIELAQVLLGAHLGLGPWHAVETGLVGDNLAHLLELAEVELLGHQPELGLGQLQIGVDVVTEHLDLAGTLVHQRTDHADGGGLARPVRAEQGEEISLLDGEIYALEGFDAPLIGLLQTADFQCVHCNPCDG